MTKPELVQLVNSRLAQVGHGMVFSIVEDGVRQEESWWHVPVLATRHGKDIPREVTVNIYANLEDELQQQHDVEILFVPVVSEPSIS